MASLPAPAIRPALPLSVKKVPIPIIKNAGDMMGMVSRHGIIPIMTIPVFI